MDFSLYDIGNLIDWIWKKKKRQWSSSLVSLMIRHNKKSRVLFVPDAVQWQRSRLSRVGYHLSVYFFLIVVPRTIYFTSKVTSLTRHCAIVLLFSVLRPSLHCVSFNSFDFCWFPGRDRSSQIFIFYFCTFLATGSSMRLPYAAKPPRKQFEQSNWSFGHINAGYCFKARVLN